MPWQAQGEYHPLPFRSGPSTYRKSSKVFPFFLKPPEEQFLSVALPIPPHPVGHPTSLLGLDRVEREYCYITFSFIPHGVSAFLGKEIHQFLVISLSKGAQKKKPQNFLKSPFGQHFNFTSYQIFPKHPKQPNK